MTAELLFGIDQDFAAQDAPERDGRFWAA